MEKSNVVKDGKKFESAKIRDNQSKQQNSIALETNKKSRKRAIEQKQYYSILKC